MRVLVTGGAGCLGRFIAADLASRGFDVIALYRKKVPAPFASPAPQLVRCNLVDGTGLPARFDAVVHAAATSPAPGVSSRDMVDDNVAGTRRLIEHALIAGADKFIFCSSLSTLGTITAGIVDETIPIRDPDGYGTTKVKGETMLSEAACRI